MTLYPWKYIRYAFLFGILTALGLLQLVGQTGTGSRSKSVLGITNTEQNQQLYGDRTGLEHDDDEDGDSIAKAPKVRKPLESYFFDDSLRQRGSFSWNVLMGENVVKMRDIDTALNELQTDLPFLQNSVGAAYTGNLGGPARPLNYFQQPQYRNFEFTQVLDSYLITPNRVRFFNVKRPFTHLSYFSSGQTRRLEENFWATHAQNISPSSGFNVDYKSRGARGIYQNHATRDKNLSAAFSHTGKKYSIHAGYIYNMARLKENGGLREDRFITDTVLEMPELLPVNLQDARNELKNNTFYVQQSYGIPLRRLLDDDFSIADRTSIFIGHSMEHSRFFRKYTDTYNNTIDTLNKSYYENWYLNSDQTHDSIYERLFSNKVFVQLQPFDRDGIVGLINGGIGHDRHYYYMFSPDEYLSGKGGESKNSTYVYGSILGKFREYIDWNANIEYHPFGYRSQDMTIGGDLVFNMFIKGRPISLGGNVFIDRRTPGYWTQHYFSNHFVWSNSFSKETETRIAVKFEVPHIGFELGAMQSMTQDKIYYAADCMPHQKGGTVSVSGLYARKDFRLGGLHLNHRVLLQFSSDEEVVPVPMTSAYLSYFYEFNIVRGVLRLQLGFDGRYNTKYYAPGYNPAIMQFHNQHEKKLGNYPLIDLFAAAKWKRMRILVKMAHLNEDLFGARNYFNALHYPLNKRVFKFGISWTFYD